MPLRKPPPPLDSNDNPSIALPPPTPSHCHQRSRTEVDLPPLLTKSPTRSPSHSPSRSSSFFPFLNSSSRNTPPERVSVKDAAEFDVEDEEEIAQKPKSSAAAKGLARWFEGTSEPVNIGLVPSPPKEKTNLVLAAEDENSMPTEHSEADNLTKPSSQPPSARPTITPRFSFFRKPSHTQSPHPIDHDELAQLDVRETLFPAGPPDEFSPAAFKNLQLNAEGTLRRFQSAHGDQQRIIRSLTSTKNIQADELDASQARNEHLKLQLEEMAERAAEQERLIVALRAELAIAAGIPRDNIEQNCSIKKVDPTSNAPIFTRRKRVSDISASESENNSDIHSIFSDSALGTDSPGTSIAASPVMKHANMHYPAVSTPTQQHVAVIPMPECQKCHGVSANEAWDVISMMKLESQGLKERIHELEGANDEALDLLSGLKGLNIADLR